MNPEPAPCAGGLRAAVHDDHEVGVGVGLGLDEAADILGELRVEFLGGAASSGLKVFQAAQAGA